MDQSLTPRLRARAEISAIPNHSHTILSEKPLDEGQHNLLHFFTARESNTISELLIEYSTAVATCGGSTFGRASDRQLGDLS